MRFSLLSAVLVLCFATEAAAHYLWSTIATKLGKNGTARIYFEEGPAPGDGRYLKHFEKSKKTWFRTVEQIQPTLLKTKVVQQKKKRWLQTSLPAKGPRSIDTYAKFGVYFYNKTPVLLHYYARTLDVSTHEQLHELARAKHMNLDIVAHDTPKHMQLKVLWKGQPAAKRLVYIVGPKRFRKNLKTNDTGQVTFQPAVPGRYTIRTSYEIRKTGKDDDGQKYKIIRHHGTLIMKLPLKE